MLNIEVTGSKEFSLVNEKDRNIIIFKKLFSNSNTYPRNSAKILKNPL